MKTLYKVQRSKSGTASCRPSRSARGRAVWPSVRIARRQAVRSVHFGGCSTNWMHSWRRSRWDRRMCSSATAVRGRGCRHQHNPWRPDSGRDRPTARRPREFTRSSV